MSDSPAIPEKTDAKGVVVKRAEPVKPTVKRTPCGYPPGALRASDGTKYEVRLSGQIVRRDGGKASKAERKAAKKGRKKAKDHRLEACATTGAKN